MRSLAPSPAPRPWAPLAGGQDPDRVDLLAWYQAELARVPLDPRTRGAYLAHAGAYLSFLEARPEGPGGALVDPDRRDRAVEAWRRHLRGAGRPAAGCAVALAAVDDLYERLGLGRAALAPHGGAPEPRRLSDPQLRAVVRAAAAHPRPWLAPAVLLLACCGLRLGELVALERDDLRLSTRAAVVLVHRTGGHRPRLVPVPPRAQGVLRPWLGSLPPGAGRLFPDPGRSGPPAGAAVRRALAELGADTGFPGLSPQVLRHTYCSRLARAGVDLATIAELAGHVRAEPLPRSRPWDRERDRAAEAAEVAW